MDYKKYSLEQLSNWMHDAMSAGEAAPQEIYDVIVGVVKDNYYTYKKQASEAYELLALLNGNGGWTIEDVMKEKEYYEPSMPPWGHSDLEYGLSNSFLTQDRNSNFPNENTVCDRDDPSPECKSAWNDFWKDVDEDVKENLQNEGYEWTPVGPKDGYPFYVNQEGDVSVPDYVTKNDKVVKWQLPVQVDGLSGDCFVEFPDDLLEAANLKEGDTVEWVDKGDGSYILRKVNEHS